jgi:hypothetical protein
LMLKKLFLMQIQTLYLNEFLLKDF